MLGTHEEDTRPLSESLSGLMVRIADPLLVFSTCNQMAGKTDHSFPISEEILMAAIHHGEHVVTRM